MTKSHDTKSHAGTRRNFLKTTGLAAASLVLPGWSRCFAKLGSEKEQKPNVLFIAIDDLNDWVNCIGGRVGVITPNLDRLAARGTLFTNAHCSAPICNPSRTSIMHGVRPSTSGVYRNKHDWRNNEFLKNVPTLPEFFMANGYTAVGGGKIFHSLEWLDGDEDGFNHEKCWDAYYPSMKRQMPHRIVPDNLPLARAKEGNERKIPGFFDWGPMGKPEKDMPDYKVVDWAISELAKKHDKPFFQAVGIFRPHIPWYVPQKYFDMYPLDNIKLPYVKKGWLEKLPPEAQKSGSKRRRWHQWIVENEQWKKAIQGYLASITFADAQLGRLLDAMDTSEYAHNTIVVLWTDHGFHLGDKETWEKFTLWEESTRIPLVFVAPGVTRAGSRCSRPASLLDVYPTLVDLAGFKVPAHLEGLSLVPQLRNAKAPRKRPAICTHGKDNHSVRGQRYHYIRYANGDEELYDHKKDQGEWNNLADGPAHDAIKKELASWLPKVNAEPMRKTNIQTK